MAWGPWLYWWRCGYADAPQFWEMVTISNGYTRSNYQELCGHFIYGEKTTLKMIQQIAIDKLPQLNLRGLISTRKLKEFYFNVLDKEHPMMPYLMKVALTDSIILPLSKYYGLLPELSHMGLFVSGFGEPWTDSSTPLGTQCLHRDNWDRKHVKVFVHLTDVTEDDGPLCLLPADVSTWLMKKTGHYWNCKPYRDDAEWKRYVSDKDFVKVTGPAGTVAIVDTSACLHYGSRTRAGRQRQVFVLHYTEFSAYSDAVTGEYEDINLPTCPELAQGLTGRQKLVFRTI